MQETGIKKIVVLSSLGVGESYTYAPWFMHLGIKLTNLKISFADHNAQELLLRKSDLDWVLVKPVGLNDNTQTKTIDISYDRKPKSFSISRKQVAKFLVDAIKTDVIVHKAPVIAES